MNPKIFYTLSILFLISLTGCYTQVATQESPDYTQYSETPNSESSGYYYEEDSDSGYYAEDDEATIVNNYYYDDYYPSYRRYYGYYYPTISIGIGFGYPYYPFYWNTWFGYWWYDPYPYYWYYPSYYSSYYSYYPYNYYPGCYYGNSYYDDDYYKTRSDYTSRLRNNSGNRGYGDRLRDPVSTSLTDYTKTRQRDFSGNGRDLTLSNNLGVVSRDRKNISSTLGVKDVKRTQTDKLSSTQIGRKDQLGMIDKDLKTNRTDKQLSGTNVIKNTNRKNYLGNNTTDKNSRQIGTQKNDRSLQNSGRITGKTGNTYKNPKGNNTNPKNNTTTTKRNSNPPKQYSSPKNNNSPKNYNPPTRTNTNNSPKSYSPPRTNNTPRTTSPPRNSGNTSRSSGNNGSRR